MAKAPKKPVATAPAPMLQKGREPIVSLLCWLLLPAVIWLACLVGVFALLPSLPVLARRLLAVTFAISFLGSMTFWYAALFPKAGEVVEALSHTYHRHNQKQDAFLHIQNADMASTAQPPAQALEERLLPPPKQTQPAIAIETPT
jgi:hypothetical protein